MLPRYTPTIHASASARTPTLSVEKQLTIIATTSAPSDNHAKLIRDSHQTFVRRTRRQTEAPRHRAHHASRYSVPLCLGVSSLATSVGLGAVNPAALPGGWPSPQ